MKKFHQKWSIPSVVDMLTSIVETSPGKTRSGFSTETKRLCLEAAKKETKFYYSVLANTDIVMENFQRNTEGSGDMRCLYLKKYHVLFNQIFKWKFHLNYGLVWATKSSQAVF